EVPNGVDFRRFTTPVPEPPDLAGIPHPRIGYVGVIKAQLDLELMSRLVCRHPEWSFVLVGPIGYIGDKAEHLAALQAAGNVHFLGHKPVEQLPAYTRNMDVAMLCYSQTDYTNFIYPLKIHESLASGVPVVATPIRSLQAFGEVVDFASTEQDWSTALSRAVAPESRSDALRARRRAISQEFDWDILVCRIARELAARIGPECVARMPAVDSVRVVLDAGITAPLAQMGG
ncbi:MAG TPA: glycosyltransferase, partial [Chromatiales bacterium]|nr:glycosyltransferase [Chromatiales bacterium]